MLSIGKLARGAEDYYLRAVASGVEDYYLGSGEAHGYWAGAGSARLGLAGVVAGDDLRAVLDGRHPADGRSLLWVRRRDRLPGLDLTFSAPKGVSLLFALSEPRVARAVRDAHDAAVAAALGYLEREAGEVRRGRDGVDRLPGGGFVAAAFRHRSSRAGDTQLHTHVLVANMTRGADGRWSALDGRQLYLQAKTAGTLYQTALRYELRTLGLRFGLRDNGLCEVAGIPREVLRAFSRRRIEIENEMARRGESSRAAAQVATLATRKAKDYGVPAESLAAEWHARADALGFDAAARARLFGRTRPAPPSRDVLAQAARVLLGPDGLTSRAAVFDRRDALRAWCGQLPGGAPVDYVERLADSLLDHPEVVPVDGVTPEGARPGAARSFRRHTTTGMLAVEAAVLNAGIGLRGAGRAVVVETTVERVLAPRPSLSAEQAAMVRRLATSGDGVEVVVGKAGSGKTHALAAAREAWQAAGHPVLGAAVAARAALALHDEAGIASMTLTRLLARSERRDDAAVPGGISAGSVIVVDEAGMLGTRPLARLLAVAESARAKVVLVGDPHQLPEMEAGGAFRALARHLGAVQLRHNRRQAGAWERAALEELRTGDPLTALEAYRAAGRLSTSATGREAREDLVAAWWVTNIELDDARQPAPDRLMVAPRRADVGELNARARDLMRRAGKLTVPDLTVPVGEDGDARAFAVGDVVVARRNAFPHGLVNGARGEVTAVHPAEETVAVRFGDRLVTVPRSYLRAGYLDHGYALTIHQAQGLTVDRGFVLGSQAIYREAAYVGMSRGRLRNDLHTGTGVDPADPLAPDCGHLPDAGPPPDQQLERAVLRSRAQHTAHDLCR